MSVAASGRFAHEHWSSGTAFVLATVGSAVGLGNIWRFPFVAGANGGGAFILFYALCIACIGIPLLMAELSLGKRGGLSALATFRNIAREEGRGRGWQAGGWFAMVTPLLALLFYSVVAGWSLDYFILAVTGQFRGIDGAQSAHMFAGLLASPLRLGLWSTAFMVLTAIIVSLGVRRGLERAVKLLMPSLAVIIVALVVYAAVAGDFASAVVFMFRPDFAALDVRVMLMALGQAFFSLAVGVGAMITYGAYIPDDISLPRAAGTIALIDTLVAISMGLAIFPLVFAHGLEPAEGPGLLLVTLPIAFGQVTAGALIGALFFALMFIAALTSSLAMVEPMICWLEEHRGVRRPVVTALVSFIVWIGSFAIVFSFNRWAAVRPLGSLDYFADMGIFDLLDFLVSNLMMPIGALILTLFSGWAVSREASRLALGLADGRVFATWRFFVRFVVPVAIAGILLGNLLVGK